MRYGEDGEVDNLISDTFPSSFRMTSRQFIPSVPVKAPSSVTITGASKIHHTLDSFASTYLASL